MSNPTPQTRRVSSKKLRRILHSLADDICDMQDGIILSMEGNSFNFHLDGGTVNITINEEGGAR